MLAAFILLFVVSAFFYPPLYFLVPVLTGAFFYSQKKPTLELSRFNRLFLSFFFVVLLFLIIQSIVGFKVEWFSLKGTARYLMYLCLALLAYKSSLLRIRYFFLAVVLIIILSFPLTFHLIDESGGHQGIFRHSNHLGYVTVVVIYFIARHTSYPVRVKAIPLFCLLAILLFTKTSGAFITLALLIAYNFLVSKEIRLKQKVLMTLPLFAVLPLFVYFFSEKLIEQYESLEYLDWHWIQRRGRSNGAGGHGSLIWRIVYWYQICYYFLKESLLVMLFGVGIDVMTLGNYPYRVVKLDPHNDFIKILVEFGFVGTALLLNFIRNIFLITGVNVLLLLIVPMFFDNAVVNFPFMMSLIFLIAYEAKTKH